MRGVAFVAILCGICFGLGTLAGAQDEKAAPIPPPAPIAVTGTVRCVLDSAQVARIAATMIPAAE